MYEFVASASIDIKVEREVRLVLNNIFGFLV